MTITPELAAILFLGTVTLYLLNRLGHASRDMMKTRRVAQGLHHGLVTTYRTLDNVLASAKDAYPEAVETIVSDFDNRMGAAVAKMEVERGV